MIITEKFIRSLKWEFMSEDTRQGFSGCESPTPMLAETPEGYLAVLDGDHCEVFDVESLEVIDSRDGITELLRTDKNIEHEEVQDDDDASLVEYYEDHSDEDGGFGVYLSDGAWLQPDGSIVYDRD